MGRNWQKPQATRKLCLFEEVWASESQHGSPCRVLKLSLKNSLKKRNRATAP